MSLLSKSSLMVELITKRINKLKSENMPIEQIRAETLIYFKNYDSRTVLQIIDKILNIDQQKTIIVKESAPKTEQKVKMIKPDDERVKDMSLGSYGHVDQDLAYSDGFKNKAFWQCAKCEYIHRQKAAAEYCFNLHNEIRTVSTRKEFNIDDLINITIYKMIGRFQYGDKYQCQITDKGYNCITKQFTYNYRPIKRLNK